MITVNPENEQKADPMTAHGHLPKRDSGDMMTH